MLASFVDQPGVVPGILAAWVVLIFLMGAAGAGRRRPLGIWLVAGILFLLPLIALTDWLIDDAF